MATKKRAAHTKKPLMLKTSAAGSLIDSVAEEALGLAKTKRIKVGFVFNDVEVIVDHKDTLERIVQRWKADMAAQAEAYRKTPEYLKAQAERAEQERREREAVVVETATTEAAMRNATIPTIVTAEQVSSYIASLVDRQHDYGTCVYAMSMAAVAAFNYVARQLGVTGFQASCADMDFIRRARNLSGPFMLLDANQALYPQYDLPRAVALAMESWRPWLKEEAARLLLEKTGAPQVRAHWEKLAAWQPSEVEVGK